MHYTYPRSHKKIYNSTLLFNRKRVSQANCKICEGHKRITMGHVPVVLCITTITLIQYKTTEHINVSTSNANYSTNSSIFPYQFQLLFAISTVYTFFFLLTVFHHAFLRYS